MQKKQVLLARNIALRFNHIYNCDYFKPPQCLLTEIPKVMSFAAPTKKMSKSLGEKHYISLFESDESIRKKVKTAITDDGTSIGMSEGISHMFGLLKALGAQTTYDSLMTDYQSNQLKYNVLKEALAETIIQTLAPIRQRKVELSQDSNRILMEIEASAEQIRAKAQKTLEAVRSIVGLYQSSKLYHLS